MVKQLNLKATRDSYGETLVELGETHKDIIVLDADLCKATKTEMFMKKYPDRFFNCGIAECNMMGVAAGLATTGKIVFASSFAMFAVGRAFEIIRNSIGYPHLNVKIAATHAVAAGLATTGKIVFASSFAMFAVGRAFEIIRNSIGYPHLNVKIAATHAGISVGEDGATHQCCEDIALMRTIPSMVILNPSDALETKYAVKAAANLYGPVYIRLGRLAVPSFNHNYSEYNFELGKGIKLKEGFDVTIIATGLMVYKALEAHDILLTKGIKSRIINIHTIKPIDEEIILQAAKDTGLIITAEEHNIIGGLGSAVCDVVCASNYNVPVIKIGVNDTYGMSGNANDLLDFYGLSYNNIVDKVLHNINMKK